jgi:hypothetical protein
VIVRQPCRRSVASGVFSMLVILGTGDFAPSAFAGSDTGDLVAPGDRLLDRVSNAVDGAESSHGKDPKMWRSDLDGPQGPMQVSAAAAVDAGGGDRFDETQNRLLGRAYLAHMYRRYRSWADAIAAYNWGPGHMDGWISGGRAVDKFPALVERYRTRVLLTSGLPPAPPMHPGYTAPNLRLSRLEMLRLQARQEFMARLHGGRGPDAVQLLYAQIIRATDPAVQ